MPDGAGLRIVTLAHGHPAISAGGAEVAALSLHAEFLGRAELSALHISCVPESAGWSGARADDQAFVPSAELDSLRLLRHDPAEHAALIATLRDFAPDIVHFHHVLGFGADALTAVRRAIPDATIVLTLHEFVSICHAAGQMVRTDGQLCERASPEACASCFPGISPSSFRLREQALRAIYETVGAFIAPSHFLAERYVAWGIDAGRIAVIDNVTRAAPARPAEAARPQRDRFAFFGQINPYKGVDLLLEAVTRIPAAAWQDCCLAIHGSGLERQPEPFRHRIANLLEAAGDRVEFRGPYTNADVDRLMAEADWIVVPSVWWENAPVVIQEAFRNHRPVIAARLGGMAEKVRDDVDGLLFEPRDAGSLAATLVAARNPELWSKLQVGVAPPPAPHLVADQHLALYRGLRSRSRATLVALPNRTTVSAVPGSAFGA
jgi:glycosyltransferase involved in cell wall biosynthesis